VRRILLAVGVLLVVAVGLIWWLHGRGDHASTKPNSAQVAGKRSTAPRPPAKPATVSGRVTRKSDGAGIAGAVVSIAGAELGTDFSSVKKPTIVATTDANGGWTAKDVPPGDYMIAVTAKGMLPSARDKLTIASAEQRTGIDFVLEAGGTSVRGTVSDVLGGPIASARITVRRDAMKLSHDAEFVTLTGADGTYGLTLPDGEYRVAAAHDDYTRATKGIDVEGKPVTTDFTLIPGGVIRGQVIARDTGKPVPNAIVSVEPAHRSMQSSEIGVLADGEGNFVVRGLSSGGVSIEARGRGYASSQPTTVQVGIGEEVDGVQVMVDGAFSIIGRVVKAGTKDGIGGARLGAFSMNGGGGESLEPSDADGAFEIPGLRPGNYILFAGAEGTMPEIGKNVEIVDKDVTDVIIELGTGVTLSGRVEPPAVAMLALELEGDIGITNMFEMIKAAMVRADSDASGAFTLKNVPPGKFKIDAQTKDGRTGKLAVTVAKVDQSGLVVQITQRASIAGRVIDTNGKPVADIEVAAHPDEEKKPTFSVTRMRMTASTAADGTFKIVGLDAGKYEVRVRNRDDFAAMFREDKDKKRVVVELAEGAEKTGITLTVEARDGVIRGVVMGADHKPAADAWVTARMEKVQSEDVKMPERFMWIQQSEPVLANAEGQFTITKLKKGKYTLIAEGPRGASHGEKTGVDTGDSATIQLARLGTLTVTVAQAGKPIPAYDLSCDGPGDDVQRHVAAPDGSYQLDHLTPGDYTCRVRADSGTGEGKVTVPADDVKLAVNLVAWGSLTGVVVSVLDGKPIPGLLVIATGEGDPRAMIEAMSGRGVKTDATGHFVVEKVSAGKGSVMLVSPDSLMSSSFRDAHPYEAKEGQRVDLGTIKIAPPRKGDAGTFGLATEVEFKPGDAGVGDKLTVSNVKEGGPAAGAGILVGDKITALDGQPVKDFSPMVARSLLESGSVNVGQTVTLTLERGPTVTLTAVKW